MYDRLTLAASTGLPFLSLAFHVAAGTVGLVSGWVALAARKGGTVHRRAGLVFVSAMIAMGLSAVGISLYEGKPAVAGGAAAAYLIFTAWTAVRPLPGAGQGANLALLVLPLLFGIAGFFEAVETLDLPGRQRDGVPAGMQFFLATVFTLAAVGDIRMIRAGGVQGTRRIARHLWRMCFGLFIASGSFVAQLIRMPFIPASLRSITVILILSAGPLIALVYWMWRVRLRQNLRGLVSARPLATS